jgi:hypothetical protein
MLWIRTFWGGQALNKFTVCPGEEIAWRKGNKSVHMFQHWRTKKAAFERNEIFSQVALL